MEKHRCLSPLCAPLCSLLPDALTQEIVLTSINIKEVEVNYPEHFILL